MYTLEHKKKIDGFCLCLEATTNSLNLISEKKKTFIPDFDLIFLKALYLAPTW